MDPTLCIPMFPRLERDCINIQLANDTYLIQDAKPVWH